MDSYENLRITKLRNYLLDIIEEFNANVKQLNVNFLSNDINNYSLDKIPTEKETTQWIIGNIFHREIYSFRSRNGYSPEVIANILSLGFFENFEKKIAYNNEHNILPDIEGIESIKCLNCGTMNKAGTNTSEFDIQIQIEYREVQK